MKKIIVLFFLLQSIVNFAQQTDNYLVSYKMQKKHVPDSVKKTISNEQAALMAKNPEAVAMFKAAFLQSEDILIDLYFNKQESVYQLKERLEPENSNPSIGDLALIRIGIGKNEIVYKNILQRICIKQKEFNDTLYKIKMPYEKYVWTIVDTTKTILGYKCKKAIAHYEELDRRTQRTETYDIVAWFAEAIPLPFGPHYFDGLPGLVLEVTQGIKTFYAVNVQENYNDNKKILKEPQKGKNISEADYVKMVRLVYEAIRRD
jgi:GLPGLI family protein